MPPGVTGDSRRGRRLVLAAAALLFLSCMATAPLVPLLDPDEGYYPATAYESMAAGRGWDPTFNGAPRWDKPVLTYLLIEASFSIFGPTEWSARLPAAVQGVVLVIIAGVVVGRVAGGRAGGLAAAVLASTVGVQLFARTAHPEIAVVLSIVTTELLIGLWLISVDERERQRLALLAAVSVGYGVLAKGPVAVALPALMLVATLPFVWQSPWRRGAVRAVAILGVGALVVAAPWYIAMTAKHGSVFLQETLWQQNVVRYTTSEFGHRGSIFYFVAPTLAVLLPWSGFLPGLFRRAVRPPAGPARVLQIAMIASAATAFLFYSLSGSKLVNYALVLVPPLAILVALRLAVLLEGSVERPTVEERLVSGTLVVLGLALLAPIVASVQGVNMRPLLGGAPADGAALTSMLVQGLLPCALVLLVGGVAVWRLATRARRLMAVAAVGVLAPTLLLATAGPVLDNAYPWRRFGPEIRERPGEVWLHAYRAPSLTFYARRPVHTLSDTEELQAIIAGTRGGWLVIDRTRWDLYGGQSARAEIVDAGGRMLLVRLAPG
jgi:4-amino-4-deoxy-L-arabinose transferase-like glycosyltransferase